MRWSTRWSATTVVTMVLRAAAILLMVGCSATSGEEDGGAGGAAASSQDSGDATTDTIGSADSPGSEASGAGAADTDSSTGPGAVDTIETWVGVDLPVPITNLAAGAGRVVYETEVEGGTSAMVVIDAATGEELARFDSDPAGRIGGVQSTPEIIDDVLFVVGPAGSNGTSVVRAMDLTTLESIWFAPLVWPVPPDSCGDDVCITERSGVMTRFDVTTGERLDRTSFSDSRVIGGDGDEFEVRPTSTGRTFTGLTAYGDYGFEERWSISARELQASAGQQVSVNGGWAGRYDESSNVLAQWIGIPWPEEVEAGDDRPFADRPYGAAFGLDVESGAILWSIADVGTCNSLEKIGFVALCRRSATFGAFEDVSFQTDLVQVVEIATGEVVWSYTFEEQVPLWDVDVAAIDGSFAVDVDGERVTLEPFAGLEAGAESDEPAVVTCQLVPAEFIELEGLRPERIHMDFVVPAREAPCLADGTLITPEEALTRFGELPAGLAVDAGNGWSVWVDEAGRPNGISTPESSG